MKSAPFTRLFPILLLCLALAACAGLLNGYGRIDPSLETTDAFEGYRVNPQYRYYISGSDLYPTALMGLQRDYRLDPQTLWKEVEMTPQKMKTIVDNIRTKALEYYQFPTGFDLLDAQGRPIGAWYSIVSARTFLRVGADGIVRIDTPELDTYIRLESKTEQ